MSSSYQFIDIKKYQPTPVGRYLFDANIWLLLLKPPSELNSIEFEYSKFMDKISTLQSVQKKSNKVEFPKIVITSLIISEVYNAYLRNEFNNWKGDKMYEAELTKDREKIENAEKLNLKSDFRKSDEYLESMKIFQSDFLAFEEYMQVLDDDAENIDVIDIVKHMPANTDFNDYYYYVFAKKKKLAMVTNDKDYVFANLEIITNSPTLLGFI